MTRFTLAFDPLLPTELIWVLGCLLVVLGAVVAFQRIRGATLRALAYGLLILALFNPVIQREEHDALPGIVGLVVDNSASQKLGDRAKQTQSAVAEIKDRIQALSGFEVRVITAEEDPNGDGTELFSELTKIISDVPADQIAGAILVTDGVVHDIPEDPAQLGFDAPVHALISGMDSERDRRLEIVTAPRFAILNEPQTIQYRVFDPGLATGSSVSVILRIDGEPVAVDQIAIGETRTIDIPIDHAGSMIVELEVEPAEDELTLSNNVGVAAIDVVREHLRVLLVSGEPHAGERTWRNVLKSDAAVDLVHFTILRPPEKQDGTPINELSLIAFPTRELFFEKIDEFDLIIFDRYQRRGVLPIIYLENIGDYIRNGGAVLIAAGPSYAQPTSLFRTPLGNTLPASPTGLVIEEPFRAEITDTGLRHPVTRDLPGSASTPPEWSHWFRLVDADAVAGAVAMSGPGDRPLLVLAREGEGRVAMLLSDHAWLWARGFQGGGPHGALLRRLVHWLMKEPELEEEAMTASATGGTLSVERQTLSDSAGPVTVTSPDGSEQTLDLEPVRPGLWRGQIEDAGLGLHRVDEGAFSALAHVGPANPLEFQEVISTQDHLAPLADKTGGAVMRLAQASGDTVPRIVRVAPNAAAKGRGWIGLRRSRASVLKSVEQLPLFGGLLGLALLVGGFAALWYREGR